MVSIKITGFEGINKVGMTKAFQAFLKLNLKESKKLTDQFLEDGALELVIVDSRISNQLAIALREANATVEVVN